MGEMELKIKMNDRDMFITKIHSEIDRTEFESMMERLKYVGKLFPLPRLTWIW